MKTDASKCVFEKSSKDTQFKKVLKKRPNCQIYTIHFKPGIAGKKLTQQEAEEEARRRRSRTLTLSTRFSKSNQLFNSA